MARLVHERAKATGHLSTQPLDSRQYDDFLSGENKLKRILADPQVRPNPLDLRGVSDADIVAAGEWLHLPVNSKFFEGYRLNLRGLLPYYEDMVKQLLQMAKTGDFHYIFIGRDAELLFDAFAVTISGTDLDGKAALVPLSGKLKEKLPPTSDEAAIFLAQFIDYAAVAKGQRQYVLVDTGFEGSIFDWMNLVVRNAAGLTYPPAASLWELGLDGKPLKGILMSSLGILGTSIKLYGQFDLRTSDKQNGRVGISDFRLPFRILDGEPQYHNINYAVASATQFMPKYTDHTDVLIERDGLLVATAATATKYRAGMLWPVEVVPRHEVKNDPPSLYIRFDWAASVDPVAAVRLQAEVVRHFERIRR